MGYLHFPIWVRLASRFQTPGNDGLTHSERAHMARRYGRTGGRRRIRPRWER